MIQLTIYDALAKADQGMGRALDRAERQTPAWGEIAYRFIEEYARQHAEFPGWVVVKSAAVTVNFPEPPTEKAWGAVIKRAARARVIERAGTVKDPNRHGNPIPLWRSLVYRP